LLSQRRRGCGYADQRFGANVTVPQVDDLDVVAAFRDPDRDYRLLKALPATVPNLQIQPQKVQLASCRPD
jgi:hypothetical protein